MVVHILALATGSLGAAEQGVLHACGAEAWLRSLSSACCSRGTPWREIARWGVSKVKHTLCREVADMCARTRWPAGHFGLAVDKAVLDALLTSRVEHGHAWRAAPGHLRRARAYLAELHRLLEPGARRKPNEKYPATACTCTNLHLGMPRRAP